MTPVICIPYLIGVKQKTIESFLESEEFYCKNFLEFLAENTLRQKVVYSRIVFTKVNIFKIK